MMRDSYWVRVNHGGTEFWHLRTPHSLQSRCSYQYPELPVTGVSNVYPIYSETQVCGHCQRRMEQAAMAESIKEADHA